MNTNTKRNLVGSTLMVMLSSLLVLSLCVSERLVFAQNVCEFEANTPIKYDLIKSCVYNITLDSDISTQTLSSIQKTIPMYVFREYVKNATDPHFNIRVDLLAELQKISEQSFTYDFDFHQSIVALFRQLNDGHTLYFAPQCYGNLVLRQPFTIISYVDSADMVQKIGISSLNNASGIIDYYTGLGLNLQKFVGGEITKINGQSAIRNIVDWANANAGGYKDEGARFNVAISNLYMTRSLNRLGFPANGETVTYEILATDGSTSTITVPWVGSSLTTYNTPKDFYASCLATSNRARLTNEEKKFDPLQEKRTAPLLTKATKDTHNVVNLITGDQVNYFEIDGNVGVITIDSFVPKDEVQFAKDFQMAMYLAKLNKISRIIIDLTNNGGGEECLGYALIKYLHSNAFSSNFETLFARTDMIATELGRQLATAGTRLPPDSESIWSFSTWKSMDGSNFKDESWYTNQNQYIRGTDGKPAFYSSILKENYCQPSFDNYYFTGEDLLKYSPDDFILLSNGRCASTCALFTRHLQESQKAKTVVVGGLSGQPQQIAQVPGGQVYEFEELLGDIKSLNINSDVAPKPLPVQSRFRFAIREAYAWNQNALTPLEFFFEASDFRLSYTKESAIDRSKVWIDTLKFFDICAKWQTKQCNLTNGQGIQTCNTNTGKYDQTCVLSSCNPGFGFSAEKKICIPCAIGEYNQDGITCSACTNKPAENAVYTNSSTTNNCPFTCDDGFDYNASKNICVTSEDMKVGKAFFGIIIALCALFLIFAVVLLIVTIVMFVKNCKRVSGERASLL